MNSASKTGNQSSEPIRLRQLSPAQLPLAKRFYKQANYRCSYDRKSHIFALDQAQTMLACVQFDRNDQYRFLRAMVVHPLYRQQGLGRLLLAELKPYLKQQPCYCLPFNHLRNFYERAGFVVLEDESLPPIIKEKLQNYRRQRKKLLAMGLLIEI